nr:hypothetical protein Iba_chr04dCG11110 [Ipomoea batatas]
MGHGSVASNIPECSTTNHITSDDRFSPLAAMHIHNSTAFFELAQPYYGLCDDHEFINLLIGEQDVRHVKPHEGDESLTANGSIPMASPLMTEYLGHTCSRSRRGSRRGRQQWW